MKTRLFVITIILLLLVTLIVQVKVLPSWENTQTILVVASFILALVTGLLFLFKIWTKHKENKKQAVLHTLIIIVIFPISFLFTMPDFDKSELVNELTIANQTIYVYHEYCFPPDSECECDTYGSLIYIKNKYLPLMHLVLKTNFYVGNVQIINEELIAKASDICAKDILKNKKIKVSIKEEETPSILNR